MTQHPVTSQYPHFRVVIPIADGCEEMEVVICTDILRRAGMQVELAGINGLGPITASRSLRMLPDLPWEEAIANPMDLLLLPGGAQGVQSLASASSLRELVQQRLQAKAPVGAICAAPSLLAQWGLLAGKRVTGFPGTLDPHSHQYQYSEDPVVLDAPLISSRGPGTAMDFALGIVEWLLGKEKRQSVEDPLQRPPVLLSDLPVDNVRRSLT